MTTLFASLQLHHSAPGFRACWKVATLIALTGCGVGSVPRPNVGVITVADPVGLVSGQLNSVVISAKANLSVTVANDSAIGADWTVTCGGNPITGVISGSCGAISPAHTASGAVTTYTAPTVIPLGNTVSVMAAATSDPTRNSSVTLTIAPQPVFVTLSSGTPATLTVGSSAPLIASVANDLTAAGVIWTLSCGMVSCGILAPANPIASGQQVIYTAPTATGAVAVTATSVADKAKSTTATIQIVPITVSAAPSKLQVATAGIAQVTGTTTDPRGLINWNVTCQAAPCGTITAQTSSGGQATYHAPSTVPGTVVLTASTVSGSAVAAVPVMVLPVTITFVPTGATLQVGTTASFATLVTNDGLSQGVSFGLSCGVALPGACGTLTQATPTSVTYTAPAKLPAGNPVLTAVSATDSTRTSSASINLSLAPVLDVLISQRPLSPLALNTTTNAAATVTNDPTAAGVNWMVTCGSNAAGACGTLTPAHTTSGATTTYTAPSSLPPGGTPLGAVTLTATSAADGRTLAAVPISLFAPISIVFARSPMTPLGALGTETLSATVTNDPANGANGVDWSCTPQPGCGTFAPAHSASGASTTYTAPANPTTNLVTLIATSSGDRTKSVQQQLTIGTSIVFYPLAPSVVVANASTPVNLTAVVLNDTTHAGVDWSTCSNASTCGQFLVTPEQAATQANPLGTQAIYGPNVHTASGQPAIFVQPLTIPSPNTVAITATARATKTAAAPSAITASMTVSSSATGPSLAGFVMSGQTPIRGAHVAVYAAGANGYPSLSTAGVQSTSQLTSLIGGSGFVTSDQKTGAFTIPSSSYTCTSPSQVYLLATLGDAGGGVNPNLALMTALGPCNGLNGAPVIINEVTTVASVWSLAQFMTDGTHVGSSSGNAVTGLVSAFGTVNNLVNIATGQALTQTLVGNGTPPTSEINTLASLLATCVESAGGVAKDGSACGNLFSSLNATFDNARAPVDTVAAAVTLAQHPTNDTASSTIKLLLTLLPASPVYQPVLTAAPNDFSIALSFTGGGLGSPTGSGQSRPGSTALAVDADGDVWITNSRIPSVTELTNLGAPLSPSTPSAATQAQAGGFRNSSLNYPGSIAIDALGNVWIGNANATLTELNYLGVGISGPTGFSGGGLTDGIGIAIDAGDPTNPLLSPGGNVWVVGDFSNQVAKFVGGTGTPAPGSPFTGSAGVTVGGTSGAIGVDGAGNVWVGDSGNQTLDEFNSGNGVLIRRDDGSNSTIVPPTQGQFFGGVGSYLAIDGAGAAATGNVWVDSASGNSFLVEIYPTIGGTSRSPSTLQAPGPLAIDGLGKVWVTSAGNQASTPPIAPGLTVLTNAGAQVYRTGLTGPGLDQTPMALAIDQSGNVWILTGESQNTLTELVGAAAPVVTPLAAGVKSKHLGARP